MLTICYRIILAWLYAVTSSSSAGSCARHQHSIDEWSISRLRY